MRTQGTNPRLTVTVAGEVWTRVQDTGESGPNDPVYSLVTHPDGRSEVTFGDGAHGRVPPPGSTITYRFGAGSVGDVSLTRTGVEPTSDISLWVAIRSSSATISFGEYDAYDQYDPAGHAPAHGRRSALTWPVATTVLAIVVLVLTWLCYLR